VAMPEMPSAAQEKLRGLISFSAPRNPVDCTAQASMISDGGAGSSSPSAGC